MSVSESSSSASSSIPTIEHRNVLIPIDASPNCERAFNWYIENLKTDKDMIFFVHVIEPAYSSPALGLTFEAPPFMIDDMTRVVEDSVAVGKKLGQKYMKMARNVNLPYKAFLHIDTKPGPAIVKSATDHKAHLIIIGSRGLGVIKRTFMGSVSDYVVHNSHVPVTVIPPQHSAPHEQRIIE